MRVTSTDGLRSVTATSAAFEVANNPPVVVMNSPTDGQHFVSAQKITLRAEAFDREEGPLPDGAIEWISNHDGVLGTGSPLQVGAETLHEGEHVIVARAVDGLGAASGASAVISVARLARLGLDTPDFSLRLSPTVQAINPGEDTEFQVYLTALNGFADPVTLSVVDLPEGWTYRFDTATLTPDADTRLTISAPATAPEETLPIVVEGRSGDLVRSTAGTADLVFGLIPQCYGRASGVITDAYTGKPIEGVTATGFTSPAPVTDATGFFLTDEIAPRDNIYSQIRADGYYTQGIYNIDIRCDEVTNLEVALVPVKTATLQGQVVVGIADPDDTTAGRAVTPTATPIEGARVSSSVFTETDADGQYLLTGIPLGANNAPIFRRFTASASGYWPQDKTLTVDKDVVQELDFELVERCDFVVNGSGVAVYESGGPAEGAQIFWEYGTGLEPAIAGPDGQFTLPEATIPPEYNNSATEVSLYANPPPGSGIFGYSVENIQTADTCGPNQLDGYRVVFPDPFVPPVENYARVFGTLRDARTGDPLPDYRFYLRYAYGGQIGSLRRTDDQGNYDEDVVVGFDLDTSEDIYVSPDDTFDYWGTDSEVFTAVADNAYQKDLDLQPIDHVTLTGIVRDRETGDPLVGVPISVQHDYSSGDSTDENGRYRVERIIPGQDNTPRFVQVRFSGQVVASQDDAYYYALTDSVYVEPGQTVEHDVEPLRRCDGGTISGIVVNAETLEPLEDARVRAGSSNYEDFTDVDGRFRIGGIIPSTGNTPRQVDVTASKSGFVSATKRVTIFCGAEIFLEFGAPVGGYGEVYGTVSDAGSGDPLEGVFVGSEFGGSDVTDGLGQYQIPNAPLNSDGSPRTWRITAQRDSASQSVDVVVQSDSPTRQDFQFATGPPLSLGISDEQTSFDPAARVLTSRSTLTVTNTRSVDLVGPIAATILIDREGVQMPEADGFDTDGHPVFIVVPDGQMLAASASIETELVFTRPEPLAFLYDVQLTLGNPIAPAPLAVSQALAVYPTSSDGDGDLWHDQLDVCPSEPDPMQSDADGDGIGDACEDISSGGPDVSAPYVDASWLRLEGLAPAGATSVRLGESDGVVDADGRFEVMSAIDGNEPTTRLEFHGDDGLIEARDVDVSAGAREE
jgi:hypothetical protein